MTATDPVTGPEGVAGLGVHDIGPGTVGGLLDAVAARTAQLVAVLRDTPALARDTTLPGWTRLHVACHLRYGAEATLRMTLAALHGERSSWYPAGRPRQRPRTLEPRPEETDAEAVASLAAVAGALERVWRDLRAADWLLPVRPVDAEDARGLTVHGLLVLRATEVEVHATDLDAELPGWSDALVTAALPFRLARLDGRWAVDGLTGSWLLDVRGGEAWVVHARASAATARPVDRDAAPPVDARIEGDPADLLALLLGRADWQRLLVTGPTDDAHRFARAFPGP